MIKKNNLVHILFKDNMEQHGQQKPLGDGRRRLLPQGRKKAEWSMLSQLSMLSLKKRPKLLTVR